MNPWRALVEAAFPASCPGCGRTAEPVCGACARTLQAPPALPPPAGVDRWLAPFAYEGVARELVARVKYRRARATVPWLATRMARLVVAAGADIDVGIATWVPTTTPRRNARGFDHAEVLARNWRESSASARVRRCGGDRAPRRPDGRRRPVAPAPSSTPGTVWSRLGCSSSTTSPPPAQRSAPQRMRSDAPARRP
ncbi:MAG: ComF family protein [Acidimicrobiia bacterium]